MTQSYDSHDSDEVAEMARQKILRELRRKEDIDFVTAVFTEVCSSLEWRGVNRERPGFIIAAAELTSLYFKVSK